MGDWLGSAVPDDCGVCSGGSSPHTPNTEKDCNDVCFGPFQTDLPFPAASPFWTVNASLPSATTNDTCLCVGLNASDFGCYNTTRLTRLSQSVQSTYSVQLQSVYRITTGASVSALVTAINTAILNFQVPPALPFRAEHMLIAAHNALWPSAGGWTPSSVATVNDWPLQVRNEFFVRWCCPSCTHMLRGSLSFLIHVRARILFYSACS